MPPRRSVVVAPPADELPQQGVGGHQGGIHRLKIPEGVHQIVVLLPLAFLFSRIGGLNMVWWSYPLAELLSLTLCIFFFARVNRNILSQLKSPTDDEKERRKKSSVRAMKKCGEEQ